ncbi:uncharacterized protein HaLaN_27954, partial [Haematococcus lacustris]
MTAWAAGFGRVVVSRAASPAPALASAAVSVNRAFASGGQTDARADQPEEAAKPSGSFLNRLTQGLRARLPGASSFLHGLLPRAKIIPQPPTSAAAETDTESAKEAGPEDTEKEELQQLEDGAKMGLDRYAQYCQEQALAIGTECPQPKLPPVPKSHPDYVLFIDYPRVNWLSWTQRRDIVQKLDSALKAELEAAADEGLVEALVRDPAFLARCLQSVVSPKHYIELEVRDCLLDWIKTRRYLSSLLYWRTVLKRPTPATQEGVDRMQREHRAAEAKAWLQERLGLRRDGQCGLHASVAAAAGLSVPCPINGLPWRNCCGGQRLPTPVLAVYHKAAREGRKLNSPEVQQQLE